MARAVIEPTFKAPLAIRLLPTPPTMDSVPNQLVQLLRQLSDELVASRLAQEEDPSSEFAPQPYLTSSAPLFAALHAVNRDAFTVTKQCKSRTQDARLEMDSAHLRLQVSGSAVELPGARQTLEATQLTGCPLYAELDVRAQPSRARD